MHLAYFHVPFSLFFRSISKSINVKLFQLFFEVIVSVRIFISQLQGRCATPLHPQCAYPHCSDNSIVSKLFISSKQAGVSGLRIHIVHPLLRDPEQQVPGQIFYLL